MEKRTRIIWGGVGWKKMDKKKWRQCVLKIADKLKTALEADYVVLGGGNAKKFRKLKKLPPDLHVGDNNNAFIGGLRLWDISMQGKN